MALFGNIKMNNPEANGMKYLFISFGGESLPIAYKLVQEGKTVVYGMIDDSKDTLTENELDGYNPERPEDKKYRLRLYDGLLEKNTADQVVVWAKSVKNPSEWFVFSDINNTFKYMDKLRAMGFVGLMPTEEERTMEADRNKAKEFVKKHYKDLDVAEVQEYSKVEDAVDFLEETEDTWVLKALGERGKTIVPQTHDVEFAKTALIDVLTEKKKDYESEGFILEKRIHPVREVTPEAVFWDGKLVFTTVDIENKPAFDGNLGCQTGCSQCIVFETDKKAKINDIAFPPVVYEMAKKHKGMFVWDASIYLDEKDNMYFGEFCANRVGWDSIFAEIVMSDSVSSFFEGIVNQESPFIHKYGSTVRVFNILPNGKLMEDGLIQWKDWVEDYVFVYDMYKKGDTFVTTGATWDTAIITGCGDTAEEAIDEAYENCEFFNFEADMHRTKRDFLATDYENAIMDRHSHLLKSSLL
jgi:phosphoribosylamine-glycine ligase